MDRDSAGRMMIVVRRRSKVEERESQRGSSRRNPVIKVGPENPAQGPKKLNESVTTKKRIRSASLSQANGLLQKSVAQSSDGALTRPSLQRFATVTPAMFYSALSSYTLGRPTKKSKKNTRIGHSLTQAAGVRSRPEVVEMRLKRFARPGNQSVAWEEGYHLNCCTLIFQIPLRLCCSRPYE